MPPWNVAHSVIHKNNISCRRFNCWSSSCKNTQIPTGMGFRRSLKVCPETGPIIVAYYLADIVKLYLRKSGTSAPVQFIAIFRLGNKFFSNEIRHPDLEYGFFHYLVQKGFLDQVCTVQSEKIDGASVTRCEAYLG